MPRRFRLAFALFLAVAASGPAFSQGVQSSDDSSNPHLKQAQQDLDNNKPSEAADEYEAALAANPKLANAEYELGVVYAEKLHDPISAIYHLKRFRMLAPNSEHAVNAQSLIDKQSKAFAATVPNDNSDVINKLQGENATQKQQLADASHTITLLQGQLSQAARTPPSPAAVAGDASTPAAPVSSGAQKALPIDQMNPNVPNPDAPAVATTGTAGVAVAGAPGSGRTYTVKKGDVIWTIAHKMYPGHTKEGVEKIEGANPGVTSKLKIGQVLNIPD